MRHARADYAGQFRAERTVHTCLHRLQAEDIIPSCDPDMV